MALISETTRPIKLSPVYTRGATLFHCPVILGMTDLHTMLFKELLIHCRLFKKTHCEPPLRHVTGSASFFVGFSAMGAEATHTHGTISDMQL